jgi:predicted phosphodiesterase
MSFTFDLISDLHVETWTDFDWASQATSPYCVVAGDVTEDRSQLVSVLTHLGECYSGVFYIDGNAEHRNRMEDLGNSYRDLREELENIKNVVYMHDNVIIINGVAILGTNGWWCYDFDPEADYEQALAWYRDGLGITNSAAVSVNGVAYHDATYLSNSVAKLQTHNDVRAIVVVSHTLPGPWLVNHDLEIVGTHRFGSMGNQHLQQCLDVDSESKIHTWCFGHYHKSVDRFHSNIRFVSNPRGRGNTPWSQDPYYPKRIEIKF